MFAMRSRSGRGGRNIDFRGCRVDTTMMANVRVTAEANEQANRLPKTIRGLVAKCLERLKKWPAVSGVKPLRGNLAGWYRMRMSDYWLRFRVEGDTVIVDKIGHRKDVYED